jgi:hypothetical protein
LEILCCFITFYTKVYFAGFHSLRRGLTPSNLRI